MVAAVLASTAFAEPLHADKRMYDLTVQGALGALATGGSGDWGVARGALQGRISNDVVADVDVHVSPFGVFHTETGEIWRERAIRAGGGLAWSIGGTGLHGVQLGARAMVGPVAYEWFGDTFCTTPSGGTYGTCPTFPSPELPADGLRVELQPNVRAQWVGHPGLTIGVELGVNIVANGRVVEREPRVEPTAFVTVGWAVPVGDPWMTQSEALQGLSPEDARKRRTQSRVMAIAVTSIAGATALGLGGTALWLATHPVAFAR